MGSPTSSRDTLSQAITVFIHSVSTLVIWRTMQSRFLFMDSELDFSRPFAMKRYPPRIRMGGFLMNVGTATARASRLTGRTICPIRNRLTIYTVI